jgi:hypothetical protein
VSGAAAGIQSRTVIREWLLQARGVEGGGGVDRLEQDEDRHRSDGAGFDAHLVEPINDRDLGKLLGDLRTGSPADENTRGG